MNLSTTSRNLVPMTPPKIQRECIFSTVLVPILMRDFLVEANTALQEILSTIKSRQSISLNIINILYLALSTNSYNDTVYTAPLKLDNMVDHDDDPLTEFDIADELASKVLDLMARSQYIPPYDDHLQVRIKVENIISSVIQHILRVTLSQLYLTDEVHTVLDISVLPQFQDENGLFLNVTVAFI